MPEQIAVRPLSRGYRREIAVEAEIASLLGISSQERVKVLSSVEFSGVELSSECQIYFARDLARQGDMNAAWGIVERLAVRIARRITRRLAVWKGLAGYLRDEAEEALIQRLYEAWLSREPGDEFWEVRFNLSMDRAISDEARKALRHSKAETKLLPPTNFEGDADPWDAVPDPQADSPERAALIADAVSRLPHGLREAFWLRYREDWSEQEIATHLGCTTRTVRNYLRRAEALIIQWREMET